VKRQRMICIRIDEAAYDEVRSLARQQGLSVSDLARSAIADWLAANPGKSEIDRGALAEPASRAEGDETEMLTELAGRLREARDSAPEGDVVVRIHLFAIDNARELHGINLRELVRVAGVPRPYATEIRKGMRLADYVERRQFKA
jgi:hypothetical protein